MMITNKIYFDCLLLIEYYKKRLIIKIRINKGVNDGYITIYIYYILVYCIIIYSIVLIV